ncbi:Transportin-1 [Phlyctochytrium bullatum]|nr:Transportin-1 [Phlyctochytrium bullatum]
MTTYVHGLYKRATDTDTEVKKHVCQGFVIALEARPEALDIRDLIPYMLMCTEDQNHEIALEACEFWLALAEQDHSLYHESLLPHLQRLISTLLRGMIYTDEEIASLGADEETTVEDRPEDIQPRFHKAKNHAFEMTDEQKKAKSNEPGAQNALNDDEDDDLDDFDDDDDDAGVSSWTLRKCSAAALDMMAMVFGDGILQYLLPELKNLLHHGSQTVEHWKHLECGILALGAVAEGCRDYIERYLPDLVSFMVGNCLKHQQILALVIDKNKRVQQAGCSALATIEEDACEYLVPYLKPILEHIAYAFQIYQKKNLLILYDAVGTLADSVGQELNRPDLIPLLMQPLIVKYKETFNDNRDIFPLFECLSSVAIALGPGFAQFAKDVWERCVMIIQQTFVAIRQYEQERHTNPALDVPDLDFVIVSLDLLSGIAQGLKQDVSPLVSSMQPPLMEIVLVCMQHGSHEVRQSAYALLGDLASAAFGNVRPHLDKVMPLVLTQISRRDLPDEISVCNNATWAAGEIALQLGEGVGAFVQPLMQLLIPIINDNNQKPTLVENAAITIGRLAYVFPNGLYSELGHFLYPWCRALRNIPDNLEKESAFFGLCKVALLNPNAVYQYLVYFCDALVKWQWEKMSEELRTQFANTLGTLRMTMGAQWDEKAREFPQEVARKLAERFQL